MFANDHGGLRIAPYLHDIFMKRSRSLTSPIFLHQEAESEVGRSQVRKEIAES
jgi:hypothetical protein